MLKADPFMRSKLSFCLELALSVVLPGCSTGNPDSAGNQSSTQVTTNAMEPIGSLEGISDFDKTNLLKAVSALTNTMDPQAIPAVMNLANVAQTNIFPTLTNSATLEAYAAFDFVIASYKQGLLPGVSVKDSGQIKSENFSTSRFKEATYPFLMTFYFIFPGDPFTDHYTVVCPTKGAAWQLERAWRTDKDGHTVVEWSVK
jgi:hypothetical protein